MRVRVRVLGRARAWLHAGGEVRGLLPSNARMGTGQGAERTLTCADAPNAALISSSLENFCGARGRHGNASGQSWHQEVRMGAGALCGGAELLA